MQEDILRGYKTLKKTIISLILASFIITDIAPVMAIGSKKSSEPKKVSISKSHKQRLKSDEFKYEYINMLGGTTLMTVY